MRGFLLLLLIAISIQLALSDVVPLGLHGSPDYVDAVKNQPRWAGYNGGAFSVDQLGWPQTDFSWILDNRANKPWEGPNFNGHNNNATGSYTLSFKGQAELTSQGTTPLNGVTFSNQSYNPSTQITTVTVTFHPVTFLYIIDFVNTQRSPNGPKGKGLTDISMIRSTDNAGKLFSERFLSVMAKLKSHTFRCFDTGINGYPIWNGKDLVVNRWQDRSLPTDAYWPLPSRNEGAVSGLAMPWEIFMQICLQTQTPGWFNLPIGADDEYILSFAKLLKYGNSYTQPIPDGTPIYIEYSNEVWNWGFSQSIYNEVKAKAAGVSTVQMYVSRIFQISNIFKSVFGEAAMGTTIRFMCMWQYGNWQGVQDALLWAQTKYNQPVAGTVWGVGEAAYIGPIYNGNVPYPELDTAAVDRLIDSMYTQASQRRKNFYNWKTVATFFGIHVGGYESGPSFVAGVEGDANRDGRMKEFMYQYYMDNWFAIGCDTVNFFALGPGAPSAFGDWYLFEQWENITGYGKFQGYMEMVGQQRPPVNTGYLLPSKSGEEYCVEASSYSGLQQPGSNVNLCTAGCWPTPNLINYLVRTTVQGTYTVNITGIARLGASVDVWLNNKKLQTVVFPTTQGSVLVNVPVVPGIHTLALAAGGSQNTVIDSLRFKLASGSGPASVPSTPWNVVVSGGDRSAVLKWERQSGSTSYTIQRSQKSNGPFSTVGTVSVTTFTDKGLTNDQEYYYTVTSSNAAGSSAASGQFAVIPTGVPIPVAPLLKVETGLEDGSAPTPLGQVYLVWTKVPGALTYKIYRDGTQISTQPSSVTCYFDLTSGSSHKYNVTAVGSGGSASASQIANIPTSSTPGNPTDLTVSMSLGQIYLKWQQPMWSYPEFGELFRVERAASRTGDWEAVISLSTNNYYDPMATGKPCYRVWATNGHGKSSASPTNVACVN